MHLQINDLNEEIVCRVPSGRFHAAELAGLIFLQVTMSYNFFRISTSVMIMTYILASVNGIRTQLLAFDELKPYTTDIMLANFYVRSGNILSIL